jgi:hypothetical protein
VALRRGGGGRFFGWSEGLQGFGWKSRVQIFFHKFWRKVFFVQKTAKKHVFHYM